MAYSEGLAERLREALGNVEDVREVSMFGSRCFVVNGKLFACACKNELLCRVGAKNFDKQFSKEGTRPLINNGRIMKGFLFVDEKIVPSKKDFDLLIDVCFEFNRSDG